MQVILLKDVEKVGKQGEVVQVRDGFGRNFLFTHKLALPATKENRTFNESRKTQETKRRTHQREEATQLAQAIQAQTVRIEVKTGEGDKLFGSVTAQDVVEALRRAGFSLDKKQVHLEESIRTLGRHAVTVDLAPEVKAAVQVEVVKK